MGFRAFISCDIGERTELVQILDELRSTGASLKLVRSELMHVTLKFLGDIPDDKVPGIEMAMREAVNGVAPVIIHLKGMGAFPSASKIRVVWVGMEGAEPLVEIARRLDEELEQLGFQPERRPFSPHLTVARAKGNRGMDQVKEVLDEHSKSDMGSLELGSIRLKKSVLGPKGPSYSTVLEVQLIDQ